MTQQPENTDPIASAGQIDDPDQPTTVHGKDDSRAGRDTQPDESSADGDPEQPGSRHRSAGAPVRGDAATATSAPHGTARDGRTVEDEHGGKPPRPCARPASRSWRRARWMPSTAAMWTPRHWPGPASSSRAPGTPTPTSPTTRRTAWTKPVSRSTPAEPVSARPARGPAPVRTPSGTSPLRRPTWPVPAGVCRTGPCGWRRMRPRPGAASPVGRARSAPRRSTTLRTGVTPGRGRGQRRLAVPGPRDVPEVEPVRHSQMVEDRVQEQERDYDLGTTEDGERYLTPRDTPEV